MKSTQQWLDEYGESHRNPTNKLIHWICVPAITVCVIALLWPIALPGIESVWWNLGTVGTVAALLFYLRLSRPLFLGMAVLSAGLLVGLAGLDAVLTVPLWIPAVVVFVIAWIGQFWGHKIEGKKPSFFQDLQFLLIGPLWLLHFVYRKMGLSY